MAARRVRGQPPQRKDHRRSDAAAPRRAERRARADVRGGDQGVRRARRGVLRPARRRRRGAVPRGASVRQRHEPAASPGSVPASARRPPRVPHARARLPARRARRRGARAAGDGHLPLARERRGLLLRARPGLRLAAALPVSGRGARRRLGDRRAGGARQRRRGRRIPPREGRRPLRGAGREAGGALTRALAFACLAALAATGCIGSGFDLTALPDPALVIVYRTRDESERRVDMLQNAKESALRKQRGSTYEASYLRLEAAADALGLGRSKEEKAADLLGRMSIVDARHEDVQPLEFAFRGDRPRDWSEDHRRLLFASLRSESIQLYEWDRGSGEVRPVTMGPADHASGGYGPDGRLVVSEQVPAPDGKMRISRIMVLEPGAPPRRLSEGPGDNKPVWSPDGRWVAYETRDASGAPAVASVPADGSAPPRVLAPGRDPTFTPDGQFVVYSAR